MSVLTQEEIDDLWESYVNGNISHVRAVLAFSHRPCHNLVRWMLACEAAGGTSMDAISAATKVFVD